MDAEDPSRCDDFPTDTLVEILRWLPPNCRRRCRLVCRQWRDTVDERTMTNLQSRAKTLLVSTYGAYILDDKWKVKRLMAIPKVGCRVMDVIGTCNGLICFCADSKPGGAISLHNPANGERLELPPLPCGDDFMRGRSCWHEAYGFAHHQGTGRYKVVRIPCCLDGQEQVGRVKVFTLGEASWQDVAAPTVGSSGARCLRGAGIVSVDGAVYWVADGTESIMSFDLEAECVTVVKPLPVPLQTRPLNSFYLVEVDGRLGIAIIHDYAKLEETTTEVWVLERARGEQRWRRWYSVEMSVQLPQKLTRPHFSNDNHYLLTHFPHGKHLPRHLPHYDPLLTPDIYCGEFCGVYIHQPNITHKGPRYGIVQISHTNQGTRAVNGQVSQAFAYVETNEPLDIYKLW